MRFKNILFLITILITLVFSGKAFPATYTYNSLNQLTEIDYGNGTVADYTYDAAGNRISVAVVDLAPPTGSVTINGGAATTNSTSVSLTVTATDNSGAVDQMMFSNDNITWSAWEPYATTKAWTLPSGDGVKTVYVQFQDLSGNISPVYSSNITLSTVIPTTIDLSVGSIAHPASAVSGATIPVTTTVANSGTGTSVGTYIFYFLSTDAVITSSDTYIGFEMVGSIAGGNSQSVTTSLILPSNLTTGAYYIGAIVDATNLNSESDENNNTASSSITINGTSAGPVDLVISSLTPPASANAGATVSLSTTVTNNGTSASTGGYIYYYLSTDAAITNADTLLGQTTIGGITGGGTQTVTASVVIPSNLTTGTYYIGAIADATNTNVETNENNNTASSAISITATSQNGSIDLAISSLVPPASANAGETITVPTTVINNGTGTSVESYVYYYISADPTIDITDTYLGYKIIGGINGGTTQNATASLILPSNLAGGTYYIGAIVDPTNSNTETDLTNNTASSSITVNGVPLNGPIDLAISSMTPPASANMGEMITMPVTIINNGTGRSVGSYIFYYLSTDPVITSADRYLGYHHVVDIDGGWTHSMTASITLPNNIYSGTYYIGAIVDPTNTNAESDETNNTAAVAITIHGIPSGPVDLSISSITPPATANAGDTITVPTTAVNNGTGTSTGTYIYYYLSTDPVITSADAFIGDTTIGGIAGSGSQSTTGSVILPSNLTTGTYYIGAIVDPGDNNAETDEANNTASTSIMINGTPVNGPVDLAISSITPPATANAGDTITVPTTAVNNGTGTSSGTYIHYYLSTDPAITSADTFIGYTTIGGIAGAGTQSVSTSVILPANLTTGTYYIGAIVDPGNNNAETDETNNSVSSPITINGTPVNGPVDLSISSITPPATANAGDTITVPTTTVNNGTGTSTGTYIYYYLSTDPALTPTDTYLGDTTVGGIAGSGSQSTTGSVILPYNLTTGTYYIGAIVDPGNNNTETDETNNSASTPITINGTPPVTGHPDLTVTSITVPANAVRGTSVSVPVTITNQGTALSTGTYVYFYLSTDANIAVGDKYLASKTIGGLSSGSSQNITGSVYIPANTAPGPYYLGVIVDPANSNAELDETNNTAAGPISITQ